MVDWSKISRISFVCVFFLGQPDLQAVAALPANVLTNAAKAGLILSGFYSLGTLIKYACKILAEDALEYATYSEDPKKNFKASAIVLQEGVSERVKTWLDSDLGEAAADAYFKAFQAGMQFPLIIDLVQASAEVYHDVGDPILAFVKELSSSVGRGLSLSFTALLNGFSLDHQETGESSLKYPLATFHSTAVYCGSQDPYCLVSDGGGARIHDQAEAAHSQSLVINFVRLAIGLTIELTGIGLGAWCAAVAYTINNLIAKQLANPAIKPYYTYLGPLQLSIVTKIITGYMVDTALIELARSIIVGAAELYLPKRDTTDQYPTLLGSKDLKEALAFGEKAKKMSLRGLSKEKLTPVAQMITRLVYGH